MALNARVKHHYPDGDDGKEYSKLISDAWRNVEEGAEEDFVKQCDDRFDLYGMESYLSEKQFNWLQRIARREQDVPGFRTPSNR